MITLELRLRQHQRQIRDAKAASRWQCVVMHRRAGKSFYCVADLLEEALTTKTKAWRGYYIGPSYRQAKAIAWDYLLAFTKDIPGIQINQSELRIDFPNGARIEMLGVENADALRGRKAHRIICDEAQLWPTSVWTYVLRPMLADTNGTALITGTPAGKHNLLGWAHGQTGDDWFHTTLPHDKTGALPEAERKEMRRQMSREAWAQEMECSFNASLQGAYFASQMETAESEGRLTRVAYDKALPVYVAVDLGFGDAMARWFFQRNGNTVQFFAYEEDRGLSLSEMVDGWMRRDFPIERVLLPHDADVHDLSLGVRRIDFLRSRGVTAEIVPKVSFADGIEAARVMLGRCYFDAEACERGIEALRAHRPRFDEASQVSSKTELHDWASHGSAAFRYAAVGEGLTHTAGWAPLDLSAYANVKW